MKKILDLIYGVINMIQALLPLLQPAMGKVLDLIPDPKAKEKARMEMEKEVQKAEGSFRDFVVAYEGRGDQVHWTIQILRGSVRPVLTSSAVFGTSVVLY